MDRLNAAHGILTLTESISINESWTEFFQRERTEPEEKLMLALLYDSIKRFLHGAGEARRWIMEPNYGRSSILTFDFICDYFDIDAATLRRRLCSAGWSQQSFERLQIRSVRHKRKQLRGATL